MTKLDKVHLYIRTAWWLSLALIAIGCGSAQPTAEEKLNNRFTRDEKIMYIYNRAVANFEQGKQTLNPKLLESAKYELMFLAGEFKHDSSIAKLKEIDAFYAETITNYKELIKNAQSKQDTLLLASYYKRAVTLAPDFSEAREFLKANESTIKRLLQESLEKASTALKAKDYARAQRYYTRVLAYDYDNPEAQNGLTEAAKMRRQLSLRSESPKTWEPEKAKLSEEEKERLYQAAKAAFEAKDYLKARELWLAIGDRRYKDVSDYLQRTVEKIEALRLED
jgi:hypothetical protein